MFKLFIALLFCVFLLSCGKDNSRRLTDDSTRSLTDDSVSSLTDENETSWIYEKEIDPMTDKVTRSARIYSNEQHYIEGGTTPLGIYIQDDDEPIVLMGLNEGCEFRKNSPLLYYRVDGGTVEHQSYIATSKNIIYIGGNEWVERLRKAKKLAVKIELANGETVSFTFDVVGLKLD